MEAEIDAFVIDIIIYLKITGVYAIVQAPLIFSTKV